MAAVCIVLETTVVTIEDTEFVKLAGAVPVVLPAAGVVGGGKFATSTATFTVKPTAVLPTFTALLFLPVFGVEVVVDA